MTNHILIAMIKMSGWKRLVLSLGGSVAGITMMLFSLVMFSASASAAVPIAGSFIENQATVQFTDDATGASKTIQTNKVRVEVLAKQGVDIEPNISITRGAGRAFCMSHQVTNTGNTDSQVQLSYNQFSGDGYDPTNIRIVIENDPSNGVAEADELAFDGLALMQPTTELDFEFGAVLNVLLCGVVPAGTPVGQEGQLQLNAFITGEPDINDSVEDVITVIDGPDLAVTIGASTQSAQQGDEVSFTINSQNVGAETAQPATYNVDGSATDYVLINFPIPSNTTFTSIDNPPAGLVPLYHIAGTPPSQYTAMPPADLSTVDSVAFGVPDGYPVNQPYQNRVNVRVNDDAFSQVVGVAVIEYDDDNIPGQFDQVQSNTAIIQLPDGVATLNNYSDDTYSQIQNTLTGIQDLFLEVSAPQCNVDPLQAGVFSVRVRATVAGDIETFTMVETGPNTGVFQTDPKAIELSTDTVANGDLVLQVTEADLIEAEFLSGGICDVDDVLDIVLVPQVSLGIKKDVMPTRSEVGGVVTYTIEVFNTSDRVLEEVIVEDRGAFGFQRVVGSASYLSNAPNANTIEIQEVDEIDINAAPGQAVGGAGPVVVFYVGSLQPTGAPGDRILITYRTTLGPGAVRSDGINTATASALFPDGGQANISVDDDSVAAGQGLRAVASVKATAQVIVDAGVFTERGYIIGKVYADCDFDRQQGHEEIGIPGIRIYMNDGTYVITDAEGKYSFYGLEPKTWVLKLDNTTLPPGFLPKPLDNRHAGVGDSRFVDLKSGELHRADFADTGCFPEMIANVKARRAKGEVFSPEIEKNLDADLLNERGFGADVKARPASGLVDAQNGIRVEEFNLDQFLNEKNSTLPAEPLTANPQVDLETLVKAEKDNTFGFIGLKDGAVMPREKMSIMLKGRQQAQFKLMVNGVEVPQSRVGQVVSNNATGIQAWEFVSVDLAPGRNQLKAQQVDQFGNVRGEEVINVMVADRLANMLLRVPNKPIADGSSVWVELALSDEAGTRVNARTQVTLEVDRGRWLSEDVNPDEPGWQVFVEGGLTRFELAAPSSPTELNIRATSGTLVETAEINFIPDLRPMLAVGLIEGSISFSDSDSDAPTGSDRFERELNNFTDDSDDDYEAGMRGSIFAKGRVLDNWLLTARYDSEQDDDTTQFRDIQPDEFYPVYGDSSQRGFDAQSTSDVYVRLDRGLNYIQYGDFTTSDGNSVLGLARYNRSMTGLKGHIETDSLSINLFVADDSTRQISREIRGAGVSGPYGFGGNDPTEGRLFDSNYVRNSEQVELIVRRRGQESIILDVQPLARFSDYQIDEENGQLLFRGPIQSLDQELNPIFIRVTYEVEDGGEDYITAGGSIEWKVVDSLAISGTYVKDDNPQGEVEVMGAGVEFRPWDNTTIMLEHALTTRGQASGEDRKGEASRAEVRLSEGPVSINLYAAKTDPDFNTSAGKTSIIPTTITGANNVSTGTVGAGREEYGLDMTLRITESTNLTLDAYRTEDTTTAGGTDEREHVSVAISQRFGEYLTLELNAGQTEGTTASGATIDDRTIGGRLTTKLPYIDNSSAFVEYKRDTNDDDQELWALGAEAPVSQRTKVYARHEIRNTLDSRREGFTNEGERHQTVFGFSTSYMDNKGSLFSEYRARDAFDGRSAEAAIGVRHGWELTDGLNLDASFEQIRSVETIDGSQDVDAMSAAIAVDYVGDPLWKATGRLEWRQSSSRRSWLNTLGLGRKLSRDWTFLGRNSITLDENRGDGNTSIRDRLQLGLAWRETDRNRWAVLARYELDYDDTPASGTGEDRDSLSHIFSMHANYKPLEAWGVSARYAYKYTGETIGNDEIDFDMHLLSGRVTYDFAERWDAGIVASTIFNEDANNYGLGLEVGYLVAANLWVSAGYNVFGYTDDEQLNADYTTEGAFIRFRYKFDENLFSGSDPYVNNLMPEAAGPFEQSLRDDRQR